MDPEGEMAALNVKLAEEENAIQHGLTPIIEESNSKSDQTTQNASKKSRFNEDTLNIILLLVLYILQGIPFGLTFSVPLILSSRKVSYSDQGTFSFAMWPFSVRLFWAPVVDSVFISKIGRRKTWLVSCFFLVGVIMVSVAEYVHDILQTDREKAAHDIYVLTLIFGTLVFLIATQDIALDAWSLDLLFEKNVGWQSIANSVGMGIGGFLGGALFLTLESEKFANQYIRPFFKLKPKNHGIITIKQFCYIFGAVSIVTSLCILIFKSEHNKRKLKLKAIEMSEIKIQKEDENLKQPIREPGKRSILQAYKLVWSILKLDAIRKLIFIFLTVRIGFSTENVVRLKLVELGVEREKISLLSVLVAPIISILPFLLKNYVNGPKPLDSFRIAYILKMVVLLVILAFVYYVPYFKNESTNTFSYMFYIIFFVISLVSSMISFANWVLMGGFCAQISDKSIGGTYLTFLGFWLGLGANWSKTATLYVIGWLTFKKCVFSPTQVTGSLGSSNSTILESISKNKCSNEMEQKACVNAGAHCETIFDAFFVISLVLLVVALLWLILTRKMINHLQKLPKSSWHVTRN